ncbi:DNA topoisomerase (ATP-hydrolyzing) subunit A [Mergibacter septicus]|uniref:DNA topoisomerase (ATP-hydrolyzing) subunit A n=1 Tax=Mergibacter septicus TaxID=221402 RepID=UPI0021C4120F|nr:DNA topoisomerase (ATP-hydrolyzing) subunit A [Mergibacter septicus]UTU47902.1 DNA topoisomerase (ATP-hydrolyzing) subunit A [Mergibacter septicus]
MSNLAKDIIPVNIEEEMKSSYLDYAMSVIVGRALPDVRDGLKPVHRRVLFAMSVGGNDYNKPYRKSARIVGDVIGKYHPHGDSAVYDTLVRMAQPFSLRYPLVDGQGNFGSIDGDSPAAMRYTEARMTKIAHELLADLDKETVDYVPNYDGSEMIPDVLPTKVPALLVNGSSGIAVGMATNIPPHNLGEVVDGCLAYIDNEDITIDELMTYIPGPDFPTAALINGRKGIEEAYKTGRGKVYIRARAEIETDEKGRESIIVHEIPYQVNKARLVEKIAELVRDKKVEGISALRDESDKDGMRIVIEVKRDAVGEVVLNNLYALTQLQVTFGINIVALDHGQPKLFNLKQLIEAFVLHRREVVTRRTVYELRKARERAHILEGLAIALANIDPVIELIRQASTPAIAKEGLLSQAWQLGQVSGMLAASGVDTARPEELSSEYGIRDGYYYLTEVQAQAIFRFTFTKKLTGLEHDKILDEYKSLLDIIVDLLDILQNAARLMSIIREELEQIKTQFNDPRRTEITTASGDINLEDLITPEDVVVTLSHEGYVKYQPLNDYEAQRRGGKGKSATKMKEEDFIEKLLVANTHDTILCFSSRGRLYWLKVYQLPQASRGSRGRPIVNLLPLEENERITAILPVNDYADDKYIVMATAGGIVKKTALTEFSRPRSSGIIAVNLRDEDELIGVDITNGDNEIMLFSAQGRVVRFNETAVRAMGRTAAGVRGIKLALTNDFTEEENQNDVEESTDDNEQTLDLSIDKVVSLVIPKTTGEILTATQNGYGKRTKLDEYPTKSRNTKGVISIKVSERNGKVVAATQVEERDQIMLITDAGTLVRTRVAEIGIVGRNTQGVRLIRTSDTEQLVSLERVCDVDEDCEEELSVE